MWVTPGGVSGVVAGAGLTGGGSSGVVTLSLPTTSSGAFQFDNTSGFVATGAQQGQGASVDPPLDRGRNRTLRCADRSRLNVLVERTSYLYFADPPG